VPREGLEEICDAEESILIGPGILFSADSSGAFGNQFLLEVLVDSERYGARMTSFTVYTNLFTLRSKPVEENLYISMYLLWLMFLLETKSLSENDRHHLIIDSRTFEYLKEETVFLNLCAKFPSRIGFCVTQPPNTLLDGCLYKYIQIPFDTDCLFYCDIDVLPVQSLQGLFKNGFTPGIYTHIEGQLQNSDYSADLEEEELVLLGPEKPGFSAGKFMIAGKSVYESFLTTFSDLLATPKDSWKSYYTLEQPLFNRVVYTCYTAGIPLGVKLFCEPTLLTNADLIEKDTILLDLCGDPGNAFLHFTKLFNCYLAYQFDS
jgi:hypothetical protein